MGGTLENPPSEPETPAALSAWQRTARPAAICTQPPRGVVVTAAKWKRKPTTGRYAAGFRGCPGPRGFSGGGPSPESCRAVGTRVIGQEHHKERDRRAQDLPERGDRHE